MLEHVQVTERYLEGYGASKAFEGGLGRNVAQF